MLFLLYFSIVLLIITVISLLLILAIFIIFLYTKVPFVKTPKRAIKIILENINISPSDTVYDLGCGDASMLIAIEKHTQAKTIGYEISPFAYLKARLNIFINRSKTKLFYKNFYQEDLGEANIIFCFLIQRVMSKVGDQLKKQLRPGTTVVSYAFPIPDWIPTEVIKTRQNDPEASKIYIYQR